MPILMDFSLGRYEDGTLLINLTPPVPIGGMSLQCQVQHRFGGISGLITKSISSGITNGASGITIVSSGAGQMSIAFNSVDTSGLNYGNYAYTVQRMDSGYRTIITEGYLLLMPSVGG